MVSVVVAFEFGQDGVGGKRVLLQGKDTDIFRKSERGSSGGTFRPHSFNFAGPGAGGEQNRTSPLDLPIRNVLFMRQEA